MEHVEHKGALSVVIKDAGRNTKTAKTGLQRSKRTLGRADRALWESTGIRRSAFSSHFLILIMDTDFIRIRHLIFPKVHNRNLPKY